MALFLNLQDNTIIQSPKNTYRILCTLGQGGYGITYLAETTMKVTSVVTGELGQVRQTHDATVKVALKEFFLKEVNGRDGTQVTCSQQEGYFKKYMEKFRVEAQNLSRLRHPNIVSVIELFAANNTLYYSMEYVEGMSLLQYINQYGPMTEQQMLPVIQTIGRALDYMHGQKMLHLDLKPNNIMLRDNMSPVIIDFGLSKHYQENGVPESSTTIGAGTPGYAPIEQNDYHGGNGFPVTLDVYALGATIYKMLTGKTPPVASSVMNEGLPLGPLVDRSVSPQTINVIVKAMAHMKGARYQSVSEMMNALTGQSLGSSGESDQTSLATDSTMQASVDTSPLPAGNQRKMKTKNCPHCGGEILAEAKKCWHCGRWIEQPIEIEKKGGHKGLIIAIVALAAIILTGVGLLLAGVFDKKEKEQIKPEIEQPVDEPQKEEIDTPEVEVEEPPAPVVKKSILDNFENVDFKGSVGGRYEIETHLQNNNNHLNGWVYYISQGSRNKMSLEGYVNSRDDIELYEIHKGDTVGEIICRMRSDNSLYGTYTNPKRKNSSPESFELYPQ